MTSITDVHTHFWLPEHQGPPWSDDLHRVSQKLASDAINHVTIESYLSQMAPAQRTIVFGLVADASGIRVPNDSVAEFVRKLGGAAVGFMSVDPTRHDACDEIERCHTDLGLQGIKLGPIYQGTSPLHPRTLRVFKVAERLGLPVMIHQGAIFATAGRLADSVSILLDDVAIVFPELRIVIAHMGHPWIYETVTVMRRHANVYADVSAISSRPTVLANALIAAKEYDVLHKVLFGSDFPMVTAQNTVDTLHRVVAHSQTHGYTAITDDELHALLYRPSFELLRISELSATPADPASAGFDPKRHNTEER